MYKYFLKLLSGLKTILKKEIYYNYRIKDLKKRGLKIGKDVYVGPYVEFDHQYPFLIEVHDHCRITAGTLILAHDATTFRKLGVTRLAKVIIREGTFIGANCIILPGCTLGPNAMIAAGSVVNRDIPEGMMAAGNPARPYGKYEELHGKYEEMMKTCPIFDYDAFLRREVLPSTVGEALDTNSVAFIRGPRKTRTWLDKIMGWRQDYEWVG